LRGAYASLDHAEAGPVGAGAAIASSPEFARCAVERVASSFLGRPLGSGDVALVGSLADDFVKGGYHLKALVRALVRSRAYREANDLSPAAWREGHAR
jgi:hypothetical protein